MFFSFPMDRWKKEISSDDCVKQTSRLTANNLISSISTTQISIYSLAFWQNTSPSYNQK